MHTTLKCDACLYNRMVISILIMININYNSLIIINIYMNECKCINLIFTFQEDLDGLSDQYLESLEKDGDKYKVTMEYPLLFPVYDLSLLLFNSLFHNNRLLPPHPTSFHILIDSFSYKKAKNPETRKKLDFANETQCMVANEPLLEKAISLRAEEVISSRFFPI